MRNDGDLPFLPEQAVLTVRRAARREITAFQQFMLLKPGTSPVSTDGGTGVRSHRLYLAFCEKLWRREIDFGQE